MTCPGLFECLNEVSKWVSPYHDVEYNILCWFCYCEIPSFVESDSVVILFVS